MRTTSKILMIAALPLAGQIALAQPPGLGQSQPLPEGTQKAFVESACTACHQTNLILGSTGYSQDDWAELIDTMIALPGELGDSVSD